MRGPFFSATGFTLIELIIVMLLTSVLAMAALPPLTQVLRARARLHNHLDAVDSLRYATERMVRELRQTHYDATGGGFQITPIDPVTSGSASSTGLCLRRTGGVDGTSWSSVAFRKSGNVVTLDPAISLSNCSAAQPQTLATEVSQLQFDFWSYGSGAAPVALATNHPSFGQLLSFVDITMSVLPADTSTALRHRSRVVLRNGAWGADK